MGSGGRLRVSPTIGNTGPLTDVPGSGVLLRPTLWKIPVCVCDVFSKGFNQKRKSFRTPVLLLTGTSRDRSVEPRGYGPLSLYPSDEGRSTNGTSRTVVPDAGPTVLKEL